MSRHRVRRPGIRVGELGRRGSRASRCLVESPSLRCRPRALLSIDPVPCTPRPYVSPRVSPDGRRVVLDQVNGNVWLYDLETRVEQPLTFSGNDQWPIWSPDGWDRRNRSGARAAPGRARSKSVWEELPRALTRRSNRSAEKETDKKRDDRPPTISSVNRRQQTVPDPQVGNRLVAW